MHPLFMGISYYTTGLSTKTPTCFGHKGRKLGEAGAIVDLLNRSLVTLLLIAMQVGGQPGLPCPVDERLVHAGEG